MRRLRRLARPTFAAESNAFLDTSEHIILIQLIPHANRCGANESADEIMRRLEGGLIDPPLDLVTDARAPMTQLTQQTSADHRKHR